MLMETARTCSAWSPEGTWIRRQKLLARGLARDPRRARAERGADGDLAAAGGGSREQQIRDVGARDQENESHGAEQHEEWRADLADERRLQRNDERLAEPPVAVGVLAFQA